MGEPTFTRIMPDGYRGLQQKYAAMGIKLPSKYDLERIGDPDKLWILPEPITIRVVYKSKKQGKHRRRLIHEWRFETGWIWDKASVPVFKDNVLESVYAAMVHDKCFSTHDLFLFSQHDDDGFRATNKLFFRMLRKAGMNWFRATYYYLAVNSIVGRALYEKIDRAFWHDKTCEFAHYYEMKKKGSKKWER